MTQGNKDLNSSVVSIKLPSHQDSPVRGFDATPDSGPQIDLTQNLKKGPTFKEKCHKASATSKAKMQPAGIMKKIQSETTNPNLPSTENPGKPAMRLLDTQGKKLAIENPETKQNKAKVIKVGKPHQKRGQNFARDETSTPYYFYYKKNNFLGKLMLNNPLVTARQLRGALAGRNQKLLNISDQRTRRLIWRLSQKHSMMTVGRIASTTLRMIPKSQQGRLQKVVIMVLMV
jgi:hypothetical protein